MPDPFDVPAWLRNQVYNWKDKLGLWTWRIALKMVTSPYGMANAGGAVQLHGNTNEATIEFRVGIKDNENGQETIVHEMLHVTHCRIDDVVEDVIIDALPEGCRQMARDAYAGVVEPYIQHMAVRVLYIEREAFEAGVKKGKKKARGK